MNCDLHPDIKLTFADEARFFGPGTVQLLKEVDRCGNVREACGNCGFSYSKGWTILKKCEEKLGFKVVARQAGGSSGGTAYVTDDGRRLLDIYEKLSDEMNAAAEKRFAELMQEYDPGSES